jgi:hypothetical protein
VSFAHRLRNDDNLQSVCRAGDRYRTLYSGPYNRCTSSFGNKFQASLVFSLPLKNSRTRQGSLTFRSPQSHFSDKKVQIFGPAFGGASWGGPPIAYRSSAQSTKVTTFSMTSLDRLGYRDDHFSHTFITDDPICDQNLNGPRFLLTGPRRNILPTYYIF